MRDPGSVGTDAGAGDGFHGRSRQRGLTAQCRISQRQQMQSLEEQVLVSCLVLQ